MMSRSVYMLLVLCLLKLPTSVSPQRVDQNFSVISNSSSLDRNLWSLEKLALAQSRITLARLRAASRGVATQAQPSLYEWATSGPFDVAYQGMPDNWAMNVGMTAALLELGLDKNMHGFCGGSGGGMLGMLLASASPRLFQSLGRQAIELLDDVNFETLMQFFEPRSVADLNRLLNRKGVSDDMVQYLQMNMEDFPKPAVLPALCFSDLTHLEHWNLTGSSIVLINSGKVLDAIRAGGRVDSWDYAQGASPQRGAPPLSIDGNYPCIDGGYGDIFGTFGLHKIPPAPSQAGRRVLLYGSVMLENLLPPVAVLPGNISDMSVIQSPMLPFDHDCPLISKFSVVPRCGSFQKEYATIAYSEMAKHVFKPMYKGPNHSIRTLHMPLQDLAHMYKGTSLWQKISAKRLALKMQRSTEFYSKSLDWGDLMLK